MPRRAKPLRPLDGPRRGKVAAFRLGLSAESRASMLLIAKGYRILARRWKTPFGEIDIVARRRCSRGGHGAQQAPDRRRSRALARPQSG
jgi:uncharacterized protein UPF0102